jgi:hypothetical protein
MLSSKTAGRQIQSIRSPSQLSALTVWRIIPSRAPNQVLIEAEGASTERVRSWERQLNHLHNACGCEQGSLGLIAGVVGYVLYLFLRSGGWGQPGQSEFWVGLGCVVATTSTGKLLGLLAAQRRLKRVIKEIQSQWKTRYLLDENSGYVEGRRTYSRVWATRCCGRTARSLPDNNRGEGV